MKPSRHVLAALLGASCLISFRAYAAPTTPPTSAPPPLAESLTGDAKDAYEAGRRLFGISDFAGAATKFRYAYELTHEVRLLWNVAACERALLHYAKAHDLLEEYSRLGAGTLPEKNLTEAAESRAALRELYSLVRLTGAPAGARVVLDGVEVGVAPLPAPLAVNLGLHTVRVTANGYQPYEKPLDVPGKTDLDLEVRLEPLAVSSAVAKAPEARGRLRITASSGDSIAIDGKVVAVGSAELELPPGSHAIRISAPDHVPYEARVELAAGGARTLHVTLERASQTGVPTWMWITGGAVVTGGLAVAGYYAFKPRDEPGASLTGQLSTLTLKATGFRF